MNLRISDMPSVVSFDGDEFIPVVQDGVNKKATVDQTRGEDGTKISQQITSISSAQLTGYTTPIQVLPAAPSGKFYSVFSVYAVISGTTPYSGGSGFFSIGQSGLVIFDGQNPLLTSGSSTLRMIQMTPSGEIYDPNSALVFQMPGAVSGGNLTLKIIIKYTIDDL